jgi:hypothetical protein
LSSHQEEQEETKELIFLGGCRGRGRCGVGWLTGGDFGERLFFFFVRHVGVSFHLCWKGFMIMMVVVDRFVCGCCVPQRMMAWVELG